ncbi:hypothetical protein SLNSH_06280 [Alsobacter soli]|uniref:Inovirus Gp2 family protein n=2 Tax=Alsobacter soli TaxID=2109933 RepID=A0A2T1HWU2_9HYPH|nr:hypothetical protein SLNSH_06280 [Alsobacter soli]
MRAYRRMAVDRLQRAAREGYGLWLLTLTVEGFPFGRLADQIRITTDLLGRARDGSPYKRLRHEHGVAGFLRALHVTHANGRWHAHLHLVVAAKSFKSARIAAEAISSRYVRQLERRGYAVSKATTDERIVHDPRGLGAYLARSWSPSDRGSPFSLLVAALHGDGRSLAAFEEASHALSRLALLRGNGVLGRAEDAR